MINLFINFYNDKNEKRQQELERCLHNNIYNQFIDKIYIIVQNKHDICMQSDKIKCVVRKKRPSYNTFFKIINSNTAKDDINILSNTDIFFNDTIGHSCHIKKDECFCLSRWDYNGNNVLVQSVNYDSQDVWIFRGKIKSDINATFTLGIPGCDNKIAYLLAQVGYIVLNPCETIQSIHMHKSQILNYTDADRLLPPYKFVHSQKLIC